MTLSREAQSLLADDRMHEAEHEPEGWEAVVFESEWEDSE